MKIGDFFLLIKLRDWQKKWKDSTSQKSNKNKHWYSNWTLKIMHSSPKGLSPVHYLSFSRKLRSFFTWLLLEETKGEMPRRLEPFFVSTSTCFKFDLVAHCIWLACGSGLVNEYLLKSQGDIHSGNTAPSRGGYDRYLTHEIFPIKKEVLRGLEQLLSPSTYTWTTNPL